MTKPAQKNASPKKASPKARDGAAAKAKAARASGKAGDKVKGVDKVKSKAALPKKARATSATAGVSSAQVKRSLGGKRATIKSVAEAAGVSIATVSFVLNKRPGQVISEPVKKRVIQAAKELNYAPSAAAAGLARKSTSNVAIVFYKNDNHITNQLYSFVVQGAIKEASAREFNILFSFMKDEFTDYDDLPKVVREKNVEGVLFIQDVTEELIQELHTREISCMAVDSHPYVDGLSTIYVDNVHGARLACRHLVELGHDEIVFLRAGSGRPSIDERSHGILAELEAAGLSKKKKDVFVDAAELTFQAGYEKTRQLLEKRPEITAMACANDELAAGAIRAGHEMGRNIPGDFSVVGFDDIIMSRYLDPPLSTISFDKEAMGRRAMGRLLDFIQGKNDGVSREILEVELIQRGSTGPAPARRK